MKSTSETSLIANQYRIQEWAEQVRDCRARAAGLSVADWCRQNGLTKATFYYRLRRVRESCLSVIPEQLMPAPVVAIPKETMRFDPDTAVTATGGTATQGIDISFHDYTVHIPSHSSIGLLGAVLEVLTHVK